MSEFVPRLFDYSASGHCLKVRTTLRLLERPFTRVPVDIFGGDTLAETYRRINPMRTTPVLELAPGRYLAESNAILLHVAEGTPLLPRDPLARADVYRWLFFETSFTSAVGGLRFLRLTGRDTDERGTAQAFSSGLRLLGLLDAALLDREFLAGREPSVADLSLYAYAHVAPDAGFELAGFPALSAWLRRIASLPGFVNDLMPYPDNARRGAGRSIYDD